MKSTRLVVLSCFFLMPLTACQSEEDGGEEKVSITRSGGRFEFSNGMVLEVPRGAVEDTIEVSLTPLDDAVADEILQGSGLTSRRLLAAFTAEPSGTVFEKPVELILTGNEGSTAGLPYHFLLDEESWAFVPIETDLTYDRETREIRLSLTRFSSHAVAEVEDQLDDSDCVQDPCRCGRVQVQESQTDLLLDQGDCKISRVTGTADYLYCSGGKQETWSFEEISDGCVPKLTLQAPSAIGVRSSTAVTAKVVLGDKLMDGQTVDFSIASGPASLDSTSAVTQSNGQAKVTLTAQDKEGEVVLLANAQVTYRTSVVSVNGETFEGPQRTKEVKARPKQIKVTDDARWKGTLTFESTEEMVILNVPLYTRLNEGAITFELRAVDAEEYCNELKKMMPPEAYDEFLGPDFLEMAKEMEATLGKGSFGFVVGNGTGTQTVELTQHPGECTDQGHDIPESFPVVVMGNYEQGKLDFTLEWDPSYTGGVGNLVCPVYALPDGAGDVEFDYRDSGVWVGRSIVVSKDAKETVTDSDTIEADVPEWKCSSSESWSYEATVEPL